ncbi:MAG: LysM peptidoglycan-binding domain-containing protein [Turneriella sp.]|nr:LysM peptidoglycan-binding domain-containing protein [Turneriella sp.]
MQRTLLFYFWSAALLWSPALAQNGESSEQELQVIEVKKGDTLAKISQKYLEDPAQWPALLKYNKIANPNLIRPGMKLKVPANLGKKPAAVVIQKSGSAQYARAGENAWKEVFIKLGLFTEDRLRTGVASIVHLLLTNQTVLRVQPESLILINKMDKKTQETIFTLQGGGLHALVPDLRKAGGRLSVVTPTAVAAVRGTEFELFTNAEKSGLACFAGEVAVSAQKVTVAVPEGMGTFVEKGKPPLTPFRLPPPPEIARGEP